MFFSDFLRVVLDTAAPSEGVFKLADDTPMDFVTEFFDVAAVTEKNHWLFIIRNLALLK